MNKMLDYSYQYKEWALMYVDTNGERQVVFFNTRKDAIEQSKYIDCLLGIVTTAFFNHFISDNY